MVETNAISPEVKNLLNKVKEQAEQYQLAFKRLEEMENTVSGDREYLLGLFDDESDSLKDKFSELKNEIESSLHSLENKFDEIKELNYDLSQIKQDKEKLRELTQKYDDKYQEFAEAFVSYKIEKNKEFKKEFESIYNRLKSEIDDEVELFEIKVENRITDVIRRLEAYDKRIYNFIEEQIEKNKKYENEQERLSQLFDDIKLLFENLSKSTNDNILSSERFLKDKINELKERQDMIAELESIDDILQLDKTISEFKDAVKKQKEDYEQQIKKYETKTNELAGKVRIAERDSNKNNQKSIAALVVGIVAILVSIILSII